MKLTALDGARARARTSPPISRQESAARRDAPFDRLVDTYAGMVDPLEGLRSGLDLLAADPAASGGGFVSMRQLARVEAAVDAMADALLELRGILGAEIGDRR